MRVVHFLLRHDPRLALKDSIQTRVFQVQRLVLCLIPGEFVLRTDHLIHRILDVCLVFLELRLEFWNLQHGYHLSCLDVRSVVDIQLLDITRFLRINIDFLEGHQFGGQSDLPAKRFFHHPGYADGGGRSTGLNLFVAPP